MTRIVVVSAGLSSPSASRLLADRLADRVAAELSTGRSQDVAVDPAGAVSTEVVELRGLAHQLVDNMLTGFPTGELLARARFPETPAARRPGRRAG